MLLEDFKKGLLNSVVMYLNEQQVQTRAAATTLAEEYVLVHKTAFSTVTGSKPRSILRNPPSPPSSLPKASQVKKDERECYYCHQSRHVTANCYTLKRKEQSPRASQPKGA